MTWKVTKEELMKTYGNCIISQAYYGFKLERSWNGQDTSRNEKAYPSRKSRKSNEWEKYQETNLRKDGMIQ